MKSDAIVAAAKNASCLTESRISSVSATRFGTVLSGTTKSILTARPMAKASGIVAGKSWSNQAATKIVIVASTAKSVTESRATTDARKIVCGRSSSRNASTHREISCSIAGSSAKGRNHSIGQTVPRDVRAKTASAIDRGMAKALSAVRIATVAACVDESNDSARSASRSSAAGKSRAAMVGYTAGGKTLGSSAKFRVSSGGQNTSSARISASGKMAEKASASTAKAKIQSGTARGRSFARQTAAIKTFAVAFATCSGRSLLVARSAAKASATAKSRAMAQFSSLCSKRITVSFAEYSRAGWFADIGKPAPEVYVFLLGKVDPAKEVEGVLSSATVAMMTACQASGVFGCLSTPAEVDGYLSWLLIQGDLSDSIEVRGLEDDDQAVEAMRFEQAQVTEIRSGIFGGGSVANASIDMVLV